MRRLSIIFFLLTFVPQLSAGTITGQIQTATGGAVQYVA